jgi:hypothetical protein
MILSTIFLVACDNSGVAMPEVKGQEVSMTQQELDELVSEAALEQSESLTTILEMNMDVSMNASGSGTTMSTIIKMNVSGKQGVKEEDDQIELVSDMKVDMVMKMHLNDEVLTDVTTNGTIGFYYIDQTAYANINQTMKGTTSGINVDDTLTRKTYREMSLTQIYQDYIDAVGISGQVEMGSSFEDLIANNASVDFKVYRDGERYSIVYEFDRDLLLEQLDGVGLTEESGISFGELGDSIGQFIVIIENDKVVDAGVNINLDININVNQFGVTGTGHIKLTMKARYTTDTSQYPALPSDLDSYDYDQDGTFGFDDLL